MDQLVAHHRRACDGFALVADQVPSDQWTRATPCTEWDARAVVEHVIGFHEFLLLRPLGIRVHRPRDDPAARWRVTAEALLEALAADGVLDRATELPGGGSSAPRTMLAALTTDVLVHTWDLAVAVDVDPGLDPELCSLASETERGPGVGRDGGMIGPEVPVADDADIATKLIACYGRDPSWRPG